MSYYGEYSKRPSFSQLTAEENIHLGNLKYLPQFSVEERDRRWWEVRKKMALNDIDALILWDNQSAEYLTSIYPLTNKPAIFPLEGEPIISPYTFGSPRYNYWNYGADQNWIKNVMIELIDPVAEIKKLGLERGKLGDTSRPRKHYRGGSGKLATVAAKAGKAAFRLAGALPEAEFVDARGILEEACMVHSPEEIEFYEKAAEINYLVFESVKETAKPGVKEREVIANMFQANIANGGRAGGMPKISFGAFPYLHGRSEIAWGCNRELEQGDLIIYEYATSYGPCTISHEHSYSLGEPRQEFKEIATVCEEIWKNGHASLRPGATFAEVERAFRSPCEEAGMAYTELGCCCRHAMGSFPAVYYPPDMFSDWTDKVMPFDVKPNMVFTHNIDIYNPKWKATALKYGDSTLVTADGPRKMSKIPVELTIL